MTLCNVQSLKNKQDILVDLLEDNKTDILVCTETWMKSGDEFGFKQVIYIGQGTGLLRQGDKEKEEEVLVLFIS